MREYVKKPDSQSHTLDSNPKASRQAPIDVILQRYKERNIQRYAEDEELMQGKFKTAQCEEVDEDELLQGKFESVPASEQEVIQQEEKSNNTGLPDNLKAGIENLSGYSMDDVKVHYNSDKPAQLQALAYAQGTDIHIAPGQEQHLPHEAWHVVQQKQGRAQPTRQLQGVNINDNKGLEKEANVFGQKIINTKVAQNKTQENVAVSRKVIQKIDDKELHDVIKFQPSDTKENWLATKIKTPSSTNTVEYSSGKIQVNKFDGDTAFSEGFGGCLMAVFDLDIDKVETNLQTAYKETFGINDEDTKTPYVAHVYTDTDKKQDCKEYFLYACTKGIFTNVHLFKPTGSCGLISKGDSSYSAFTTDSLGEPVSTELFSGESVVPFLQELIKISNQREKQKAHIDDNDAGAETESCKCYLTSACVSVMGLSDNCEELTLLRKFRDGYLINKPNGEKLIKLYYQYAPQIVENIDKRSNKLEIYRNLYEIIKQCVIAIINEDNEFAFNTYCSMVRKLHDEFIDGTTDSVLETVN